MTKTGIAGEARKSVKSLSRELLVAREILVAEKEGKGPVYFNRLVERLSQRDLASRATVSKALDVLFDQGVVRAHWTTLDNGTHVRELQIAGESREFIEYILTHTE